MKLCHSDPEVGCLEKILNLLGIGIETWDSILKDLFYDHFEKKIVLYDF